MLKTDTPVQFSQLVDMTSPVAVLEEVKSIFVASYHVAGFEPVRKAFADFLHLYAGRYPGYRACNTRYHDKMHSTDALLALARLMDGYNAGHKKIPARLAELGLIAAVFHDAGFIESVRDKKGTGAKYTLTHVDRGVAFVKAYFRKHGYRASDARTVANLMLCTELSLPIEKIRFSSPEEKTVGLMLGAADLLGQMASRCYLERLPILYKEFKEGHVGDYSSELDLLRKTIGFAGFIEKRLKVTLLGVDRYARLHFRNKYRINRDLYREAMEKQLAYLRDTVLKHPDKYRSFLRRAV